MPSKRSTSGVGRMAAIVSISLVTSGVVVSLGQSPASPPAVEVTTPKPPTAVAIEGQQALVYELHITNFGSSALKLAGVQVFAAGDRVADYSGPSLVPLLRTVGAPMQMNAMPDATPTADPSRVEAGRRVIAFIYLTLPPDRRVSSLRHRLVFDPGDSSSAGGGESVLDNVVVPVLTQAPPALKAPMRQGMWLAGNGPSNASDHRRSVIALSGRASLAQRFATDWMLIGPNGNTFHDGRGSNDHFWGFGQPIVAVADGEVTEVVDNMADHPPDHPPHATLATLAGNHIILRIAPGVYALFAHLKQGSIRVRPHQRVKADELLAELGDSGNTTAPHLHFQLMDANAALAAEGIPYVFEAFRFLGFGKDFEMDKHPDQPRSHSLPMDDTVVQLQ